jgi:hypothetical protein
MEDEYGVVPMPKYDRNQDGYYTLLHDQFTVVAIPTTVVDERLDMVSAVLEAMSVAGYEIVKPVYYEDTLRTKLASDPQTSLMLEIITDGIYIDLGIIDIGFGVHSGLRDMMVKKINTASSLYQSISQITKNRIKEIMKSLDKLALEQE